MRYRFIHIPKTGGSTFRKNVEFGKLKTPILMGHEVDYNPNDLNITFIRNPIDRTISHYNETKYYGTKILKFTDWFRKEKYWDFQTKWLLDKILRTDNLTNETFNELLKILKSFFFVGITENLDKDLDILLKKMKVKKTIERYNVRDKDKRYTPTKEEIELIKSKNFYDFKLYNNLNDR